MENWIIPNGIRMYVLMDNEKKFTSRFFEVLWAFLGAKHLKTAAYHLQGNKQAERSNNTIFARPKHFVAEHQKDWKIYIQAMK